MQERYLCRAKRIDNGEWVEGYYCKWLKGKRVVTYSEKETDCIITWMSNGGMSRYEVDPSTICQCTGLHDKNGKLIWENDIVKRKFRLYSGEIKYEEKENCGVVKYDKKYARFGYQCSVFAMLAESRKHDTLEVVGNVFDNPELLEGSHDGE